MNSREVLEQLIALHRDRGETDRATMLRQRLDALPADGVDGPSPDDTDLETAESVEFLAAFSDRVAAAMSRYGVTVVSDLASWDSERLLLIPGFTGSDVRDINATLIGMGAYGVLGSGDVPKELPELDPAAMDRKWGRTEEDVDAVLRLLASGKSQRKAAKELGAAMTEGTGNIPHQRSQSLQRRFNNRYVGFVLEAFEREFKKHDWWVSVGIDRSRPRWALKICLRVSEPEARRILKARWSEKRGVWGWRSADLVFIGSGQRTLATGTMRDQRARGKRR